MNVFCRPANMGETTAATKFTTSRIACVMHAHASSPSSRLAFAYAVRNA